MRALDGFHRRFVCKGVCFGAAGANLNSVKDELVGVINVYANEMAFAALRSDGTVRAWGPSNGMLPQCMLLCMSYLTLGCLGRAGWIWQQS